mmetsp:Transcript_68568/g.200606  ORF Transcript_68568/g.200606 Transcript_68568/m.200606 type:complete len:231 (+) Transcript_68568:739-1431(+)
MTWSVGEKATHQIPRLCPVHSPNRSPCGNFQMRTSLSCPPEAISLLFGETTTSFTSLECATTTTFAFSTRKSSPPPPAASSCSLAAVGSSQIFMILSWLALTSARPWAALCRLRGRFLGKESAETGPVWPESRQAQAASSVLQIRTLWSLPPVAIHWPSGETSQATTMSVWPRSSFAPKPFLFTMRGCSSLVMHTKRFADTLADPPSEPFGHVSSGMNCTCTMSSLWPMM